LIFFYDKYNFDYLLIAINPDFFNVTDIFNLNTTSLIMTNKMKIENIDSENEKEDQQNYIINKNEFLNDLHNFTKNITNIKFLNNKLKE
jgi:hypothetical protein